jgi:CRP-like cAMP-binding protein
MKCKINFVMENYLPMRYVSDDDDIPENELDAFDEFIHIYSKDDVMMTEGQTDDSSLFLLRKGRVGVYRNIDGKEQLISEIYAINFFGEMELIHGGPRYATIRALSHEIIVYKFRKMNLHYIYSNPRLAEKLIVRLSGDIKNYSNMLVQKNEEINKINQKMENQIFQNAFVLLAMEEMQEIHLNKFHEKTESWKLFDGILHLSRRIMKVRLPEVYETVKTLHGYEALSRLERDGVITSSMFRFLTSKPGEEAGEVPTADLEDEPNPEIKPIDLQ